MVHVWEILYGLLYLCALPNVYATDTGPTSEISIGPLPTSVPDQTVQTTAAIAPSFVGAVVLETVESLPNDAVTTVTETFLPTTFSQYATQSGTSTISVTTQGTTIAAVVGPGGVGWQFPSLASGEPAIQPPTTIPAASDTPGVAGSTLSPSPSSVEPTTTPSQPAAESSTTIAALVTTATGGSEATDVLTATDGTHQTTPVIWTRTIVPAGQTLDGVVIPTAEPAWACSGPLCNPECLVPLVSCQPTDENGKSGANGFAFATQPPPVPPQSPTTNPSSPPASVSPPDPAVTGTVQTPSPSADATGKPSTTTSPSPTTAKTTPSSTSTSTSISTSTSTEQLCDWSFSACVANSSPTSIPNGAVATAAVAGTSFAKRGFSADPGQNLQTWFVFRAAIAEFPPHCAHTPPNAPNAQDVISLDLASSAIVGDFPVDKEATYAATGLFGCTSVIAVSRLGVWVSHIWQKPFEPFVGGGLGSPMFQQEVIDFLRNGNQAFDRLGTPVTSPGLLGLDKLALKNHPQFIIMTPRDPRVDAVPGQLRYPAEIAAIISQLNNIAPGVPVTPFDYVALQQLPASQPKEPKGKIMIQYSPKQPFQGCEQVPQYQVWVEAIHFSNNDDQWLISNRKRDTSAPLCSTTLATSARSTDTSAPSSGTEKPSSDASTATSPTATPSSATPPKPINTILPGKPSATPATSAHNLAIWQGLGIETNQPDVYLYANVSDNVGLVLATGHAKLDWSKNLTLITDTTPKHTIIITPTSSVDNNARKRVSGALGNKPQYTKGSVLVAVDDLPVFDAANINEGNQGSWKQDKPGAWFKTVFGSKPFSMSNRNLWSLLAF